MPWAHPHLPNGGKTSEWWTPPAVFDAIGLRFDLDPCAPPRPFAGWIPASRRVSLPENGLAVNWEGRVWLNPPYGREAGAWMRRLAAHAHGRWRPRAPCASSGGASRSSPERASQRRVTRAPPLPWSHMETIVLALSRIRASG